MTTDPVDDLDNAPFDPDSEREPEDGVGLCLSGGGFRAMLFHVGTLRRLNESGRLRELTHVSSVSGGSITAGVLGMNWMKLTFDANGRATNFTDLIERPLLEMAARFVDARALMTAFLVPGVISKRVARLYDKYLFHGATLQDLPSDPANPFFVILATNLSNGRLWRFSQRYMRDWDSAPVPFPSLPIADAVAASSSFPPFLSPSVLRIEGRPALQLSDGGVYDNLGVEPIVKNCRTVYVSDGGGPFQEEAAPPKDWVRSTKHLLNVLDAQVRRLRRRQVVGLLAAELRQGVFVAINTDYARFDRASPTLPATLAQTKQLAEINTRLFWMPTRQRRQLINWGYALCDAALRTYVDHELPEPAGFPYPEEGLPKGR